MVTQPPNNLHIKTDISSLCCSSISDSEPSLSSPTAVNTMEKVTVKKYSKMAFIINRLKKNNNAVNDDISMASLDSSLSSRDLFNPKNNINQCTITFQQRRKSTSSLGERGAEHQKKKKGKIFRRKKNYIGEFPEHFCDIVVEEDEREKEGKQKRGGIRSRYGYEEKSRKKVAQRKYSRLAFSVQLAEEKTLKKVKKKSHRQSGKSNR